MIWLDLILLSSPLEYYMLVYEIWGLGEYQLPWGSLKSSSRPPLLPEFNQWSPFLGWGHFAFLHCSSCPDCQGTLCPAALGNSGLPFLWLGAFLLPVVPSLLNALYCFFCHPWSWFSFEQEYLLTSFPRDVGSLNSSEYTLHFTVSFMLLDCGHRITSL